jgi:hypothetical protein
MEYRNRAERRRAKKQGEKVSKPPVYNYTPGSLRNQLDWEAKAEVRDQLKKVREEATADAINTAMMLLLTLPCNVLIDKYWKDEPEKVQDFLDNVLDQYSRWQNGELDMDKLRADLWEIGGIRLEEKSVGYKNQSDLDKINKELKAVREDLEVTRIIVGDEKVIQTVGLTVKEKGNKDLIKKLKDLGFTKTRRKKVVERGTDTKYEGYSYFLVMEKDL